MGGSCSVDRPVGECGDPDTAVITVSDSILSRLGGGGELTTLERLRAQDAHWYKLLACINDLHTKEGQLSIADFDHHLEVLESMFKNVDVSRLPCREAGKRVKECYRACPDKPLTCSGNVERYKDCVENYILNTLAKKEFDSKRLICSNDKD